MDPQDAFDFDSSPKNASSKPSLMKLYSEPSPDKPNRFLHHSAPAPSVSYLSSVWKSIVGAVESDLNPCDDESPNQPAFKVYQNTAVQNSEALHMTQKHIEKSSPKKPSLAKPQSDNFYNVAPVPIKMPKMSNNEPALSKNASPGNSPGFIETRQLEKIDDQSGKRLDTEMIVKNTNAPSAEPLHPSELRNPPAPKPAKKTRRKDGIRLPSELFDATAEPTLGNIARSTRSKASSIVVVDFETGDCHVAPKNRKSPKKNDKVDSLPKRKRATRQTRKSPLSDAASPVEKPRAVPKRQKVAPKEEDTVVLKTRSNRSKSRMVVDSDSESGTQPETKQDDVDLMTRKRIRTGTRQVENKRNKPTAHSSRDEMDKPLRRREGSVSPLEETTLETGTTVPTISETKHRVFSASHAAEVLKSFVPQKKDDNAPETVVQQPTDKKAPSRRKGVSKPQPQTQLSPIEFKKPSSTFVQPSQDPGPVLPSSVQDSSSTGTDQSARDKKTRPGKKAPVTKAKTAFQAAKEYVKYLEMAKMRPNLDDVAALMQPKSSQLSNDASNKTSPQKSNDHQTQMMASFAPRGNQSQQASVESNLGDSGLPKPIASRPQAQMASGAPSLSSSSFVPIPKASEQSCPSLSVANSRNPSIAPQVNQSPNRPLNCTKNPSDETFGRQYQYRPSFRASNEPYYENLSNVPRHEGPQSQRKVTFDDNGPRDYRRPSDVSWKQPSVSTDGGIQYRQDSYYGNYDQRPNIVSNRSYADINGMRPLNNDFRRHPQSNNGMGSYEGYGTPRNTFQSSSNTHYPDSNRYSSISPWEQRRDNSSGGTEFSRHTYSTPTNSFSSKMPDQSYSAPSKSVSDKYGSPFPTNSHEQMGRDQPFISPSYNADYRRPQDHVNSRGYDVPERKTYSGFAVPSVPSQPSRSVSFATPSPRDNTSRPSVSFAPPAPRLPEQRPSSANPMRIRDRTTTMQKSARYARKAWSGLSGTPTINPSEPRQSPHQKISQMESRPTSFSNEMRVTPPTQQYRDQPGLESFGGQPSRPSSGAYGYQSENKPFVPQTVGNANNTYSSYQRPKAEQSPSFTNGGHEYSSVKNSPMDARYTSMISEPRTEPNQRSYTPSTLPNDYNDSSRRSSYTPQP